MGTVFESSTLPRADATRHLPASTGALGTDIKVAFRDSRAFIPIARSGCGVACKYCYISAPASKAVPLSRRHMYKLLDELRSYIHQSHQPRPIMAIGCDTEVGVSPQLTDNALICLDFAARYS